MGDMALQLIVVMVLQLVVLTLDMELLRAVQVQNMELQLTVATVRQLNMVLLQKFNLIMEIRALRTILLKLHETDEKINSSERAEKIIEMEEGKIRKITEITGGKIIEIEEDVDYQIEIEVAEPVLWMQ